MMNQPDELMNAFRGTALQGLKVEQVPGSDVLVVTWPDPKNVLTGWQAARDVMAVTGRRPLAVSGDYSDELDFYDADADDVDEVKAAARSLDPWPKKYAFDAELDEEFGSMDEVDLETVSYFLDLAGAGPDWDPDAVAQELLPGIPVPTTTNTLNQHLLNQIWDNPARLAQLSNPDGTKLSGRLDWFEPPSVQLALLPTTSPWLAAAWISYFGEDDNTVLAACLRHWHQAWGAEVVASWGTMLQFVTTRRPAFGPDAFELARQHLTMADNLEIPPLPLAWELANTNAWFLHERP